MKRLMALSVMAPLVLAFVISGATFALTGNDVLEQSCTGSSSSVCRADGSDPISGNDGVLMLVVNILSAVVGIAAVIMIIVSGISYMTSQGDSSKIQSAKNTIIYAVVGLIVVLLSRTIIGFVAGKV